jgi:hypothetical protein
MSDDSYHLGVNTREYTITLLVVGFVLVVIDLVLGVYNYQVGELPWLLLQLFDLDEENNIPTWFSSFLLLNNAFFLYLYSSKELLAKKAHWRFLAFLFLLLAIDEVAGLHETFNSATEISWAIPGAIVVLLIGAMFVPFLLSLPRGFALCFILAGAIYVSGAIVIELLSEDLESDTLAYRFAVSLEESFEMLGAWFLLFSLLKRMKGEEGVKILLQ